MVKLFAKTMVFYLVFIAFISIPAVYEIFVLGRMDRKFINPWTALEVYYFGSGWIWSYLALVFLALSWLSNKLTNLDISYLVNISIAFVTALICIVYTRNEATAWELSLKPDCVGIITIAAIFCMLNFLKFKKLKN